MRTFSSGPIAAARSAYDALTEEQKALVPEEKTAALEAAEKLLADYRKAADDLKAQRAKDQVKYPALGDRIGALADAAAARGAEVALFGHTHKPTALQKNGVFLFNPGSCGRCYTGPNTYGVMLLDKGKITSFAHKEVPQQ
mgnify:CR=1 FL=1